ncbi:hypothetical protein ABID59_006472 [Bradyrhizobium sp. S3.3.6]|uniref:SNF2-related protein n=1 Tax=Bradyrhizobium sp. S3.3.6 TaxID=3156429 RepID=UPI0033938CDA
MSIHFQHEFDIEGLKLRLVQKPIIGRAKIVPVEDWAAHTHGQAFVSVSHVLALADANLISQTDDAVILGHDVAASMTEPQALGLGLPPTTKAPLQIETRGLITEADFRILYRWIGPGNRPLRVDRMGCRLIVDGGTYRLSEPLYSMVNAIDEFGRTPPADQPLRMAALARLQALIPEEAQAQLSVDRYFSSFRVLHATAFSLSLRTDGREFDFDPVLFGRRAQASQAKDEPISETEGLLTGHQQEIFARDRFRSSQSARASYLIESGVYVYLDKPLQEAVAIVRNVQRADAATRKRFVQSPQLYLKEGLSESITEDEIDALFIETEQYSARVVDVGIWVPPIIPWIKKEPNDWLPEKFGLRIGDQYISLTVDDLAPLRESIREAIDGGKTFVNFGSDQVQIPATKEAEQSIAELLGIVRPNISPDQTPGFGEPAQRDERRVLIVEENFESLGFERAAKPRQSGEAGVPTAVRSTLKKHQVTGLRWLQTSWRDGYPGALLADDMGLGKTLQALSFLAWIRENELSSRSFGAPRRPLLIVSPTGLLANWEKEQEIHLHRPGLGEICRAYGRHLRLLKVSNDQGFPELDNRRIQEADLILTTYETLRDYHLSFGAIRFNCVVFDEMQKVKSPTSLITRAAKSVNADYTLGLTGTPIENQLVDLWCIMDIVSPGSLGDLKTFCEKYRHEDEAALEQLHARMLTPNSAGAPPPMLRRMKADELDGLPQKMIHIRRRQMPADQAQIYAQTVARAKQPDAGPMLETLHMLRGISLHPIWPPAGEIADERSFIEQSARLSETFDILDEIAARREKVLIFLESLDLQAHLALMIKRKYGLKHRPMQINGDVAGENRQKLVDKFQEERGTFDVMILSPRAGGVGLTLTAANHVIHLSRWWNPAVEDQCTDRVYRIGQVKPVNVYYPMAVHPLYGSGSFDELLNALLTRKRKLSERMLMPQVNLKADQSWFADGLGRASPSSSATSIDEIDRMEPLEFERWVLAQCGRLGWEVSRTPSSRDGGADGVLIHRATSTCLIVQCKHTQSSESLCDDAAINDLLRARTHYSPEARLFAITNARAFSRTAMDRAERHKIELIAREEVSSWPSQLLS